MIEYVISQNPDHRVLDRASKALKNGELVCLPTDTNWVVVCDMASKHGVDKLYRLRKADPDKHFSLLCDSISRASELAFITDGAYRQLKHHVPGHFTFIFEAKKKVVRALKASKRDHEIGIRFPPNLVVQELIRRHGEALLSANITHEILGLNDTSIEIYGFLIEDTVGHQLGMVLDPGEYDFVGSSSIVSFLTGKSEVIRKGAGDTSGF